MASLRSEIELRIRATVDGVRDAVREVRTAVRGMSEDVKRNKDAFDAAGTAIRKMLLGLAAVGAISNAAGVVAALTASIVNLLPAAFILPGILAGAAVAIGTFKLATAGLADALKGDADALAKLAPNARAVVTEVNALKPAFDALRKSVQQEFFKNFAGDLKNIAGIYMPILQRFLPQIATEFNNMGRSATRALTEIPARMDFREILENTVTGLGNMRQSIGHVISGFLGLAAVGSDYLPAIGTAIDGVAAKFKNWADDAIESGRLKEMIDNALAGFRTLGNVVDNVGGIIRAVFTGLSSGGAEDFFTVLERSTGALREFLETAGAQTALGALGDAFRAIGEATQGVFLEALRQLAPIIVELAPVFAEIAQVVGDLFVNALKIVGPLLLDVAKFLNDNKTAVGDLAPLVIGLWAAFKGASILATVVPALRAFGLALGGPVAVLKLGGIVALGALAVKLDEINQATAKAEGRPLNELEDDLNNLVGAGRQILTLDFGGIFADISSEWDEVVSKFQSGESPIGGFFQRLGEALKTTGESFSTMGKFIADFVTKTGESFSQIGEGIKTGLVTAATAVSDFFTTTIPDVVGGFFESVGTGISDGVSAIGTTISDAFNTVVDAVKGKLTEISTATSDFLTKSPYEIGFAIGAAIGDLLTQIGEFGARLYDNVTQFMTDFATQIQTGITNAVTYFTELPGRVGTAIADLTNTLATKAQEAGQAFLDWIGSFFTNATDRAAQVPDQVGTAVAGTATTLRDRAIEAGTQFVIWITNKFNEAVAFVQAAPGKIGAAISSVVGILRDKAIEAGTSFVNGVTTKFNEAVEYVKGVPGRLVAAIGNLGNLLVNAGKSLMDGLLSGIKSAYNTVIDFVSGIAGGIASHKGPLSYDKVVLRPAGLALMDGLLGGLSDGNDRVQAFVSTIAGQLAAAMSGSDVTGSPLLARVTGGAGVLSATGFGGSPDTAAEDIRALLARLTAGQATPPEVRVFIGDQELRGLVRVEMDEGDRETIQRAGAGPGASY